MLAFRIEVEGQAPLVAGVADWSIHVNARREEGDTDMPDDLDCSVGGLTTTDDKGIRYHFRWPRVPLQVGSSLRVTLVEVGTADEPVKRYRSDKEIQESPFTEEKWKELRRQDYETLKKEFESDAGV
jgi:hypothetical protein